MLTLSRKACAHEQGMGMGIEEHSVSCDLIAAGGKV